MRIGVDLGGTKIEAAALDRDGRVVWRTRRPTPRDDYDATLRAIGLLVRAAERETGELSTVGIAMPGTLSPATGLVKNANSVWLNGRPLSRDLSASLGRPVRFANDANCFVLSEVTDGAASGAEIAFGVIVGTGTGGGIAVHGRPLVGANAIAGEWGHNAMPFPSAEELPGLPCYCGRTGCIETMLSGPGVSREYASITGKREAVELIVSRAAKGEREANAVLDRYEDRMARALASVINVLDPHVIVLGGGLSNIGRLYTAVPRKWGRFIFSDRVDTRLVRAAHGDSSGVRGAAWLWSLEEADMARRHA